VKQDPSECSGEVQFYNSNGICQKIAKSPIFGNVSLTANAVFLVWIGVEADTNSAASVLDSNMVFQSAHFVFLGFFVFDVLVRVLALQDKKTDTFLPLVAS
jgi:hypothetical protein